MSRQSFKGGLHCFGLLRGLVCSYSTLYVKHHWATLCFTVRYLAVLGAVLRLRLAASNLMSKLSYQATTALNHLTSPVESIHHFGNWVLVTTSAVIWSGALCVPMAALVAWAYGQYITVIVLNVLEMTKTRVESQLCLCVSVCATFFSCTVFLAGANMENLDVRGCSSRLTSAIQHQFWLTCPPVSENTRLLTLAPFNDLHNSAPVQWWFANGNS